MCWASHAAAPIHADQLHGADTITTMTGASNSGVYTFLGSGGTYPSLISSANDFILAGGVSWSALAGTSITFKAFNVGAGTWKFIEQSRA